MKHIVKIMALLVALSALWISLLQTSVLPQRYTWLLPLYFIVSLGCYGLLMVGVGLIQFPTCPHEAILLQEVMEYQVNIAPREPRILLAASGSVAAIKFANLCHCFYEWAEGLCNNLLTCIVRAWDYSKPMFIAPAMNTFMWNNPFTERHLMVIDELGISLIPPVTKRLACGEYGNGAMAEPSLIFSTIAGGLCNNLLTCIVRAWDYNKPMFIAPAMNTFMWNNPFTERHLMVIDELGISLIPPVSKTCMWRLWINGAMAEPSLVFSTVRLFFETLERSSAGNS